MSTSRLAHDDPAPAYDMARLAAELQHEPAAEATVEAIVLKAVETVPETDFASITVRARRGRLVTLGSSHEIATEADELQYVLRQGPCVEVAYVADWLRSGDLETDPRWPDWGPKAAALGVSSLLSVPLQARGELVGALNMYASDAGSFGTRDEVDWALLFAAHAGYALSSARLVTNLQAALSSRHDNGMAQGVLIERFGLDPDAAFKLIQRVSSDTKVKIATLAKQIVETGVLPGLNP